MLILEKNEYLKNHPRAKIEIALKTVEAKSKKLRIDSWVSIKVHENDLVLELNEEKLKEESRLDGCYVIKTNLQKDIAATKTVHDRYKDLALVEWAFRTCKSNLEIRPVFVQMAQSTYGHVFIVMLTYMIIRELEKAWAGINILVEEGLSSLSTLTTIEVCVKGTGTFQKVPEPRAKNRKLLEAADIVIPKVLPKNEVRVATKKTLSKST